MGGTQVHSNARCLASSSVSRARSARQAGLYFCGYVVSLPKGRNAPKRDSWGIEPDEIRHGRLCLYESSPSR
jgi:hypothetical protein